MTGAQNPEAYNICGYRFGEVDPNKWMVFGAHFDIAPPVNGGMLDPHIFGRTYGTRVGAYDNTAGTSMVLEVARAWQIIQHVIQWFSASGPEKKVVNEEVTFGQIIGSKKTIQM